jgi:hypothetical protein
MRGVPNAPLVSFRTVSYEEMVISLWGAAWNLNDIAYEMSNGRQFESTDKYLTGIYGVTGMDGLLDWDPTPTNQYPDMYFPFALQQENGGEIGLG